MTDLAAALGPQLVLAVGTCACFVRVWAFGKSILR